MKWDVNRIDAWFRNALVAVSAILMALQFIFGDDNAWLRGSLILAMAGVVGYFTNLLALKMLFQPKQGRILGWEGLVPKNKALIAEQLGESVQTQLLSPDIIMEYINEHQMITRGTERFESWLDAQLQNSTTRIRINARVISLLYEHGPDLMHTAFDFSEARLKAMATNPGTLNLYWPEIRSRLGVYLQKEENRRKAAEQIRKGLMETLPRLAELLDQAINDYLSRGNTMSRVGRQLKQIASIDEKTFRELLEGFVTGDAMESQFIGVADILMQNLQAKIEAPETQTLLEARIGEWFDKASSHAREILLPQWIESLRMYLANPANWQEIDRFLQDALTKGKDKLLEYINSPEGQQTIRNGLEQLVSRLNVSHMVRDQVMKLDTDELEKMILDNTGGNLVVIQTLGGVLGLFVGTIQVNVWFAIPVFAIVGIVGVLGYFNSRKYRRQK
ncbi:Hypothetical protein HDN1F_19190 [gamma proteobacterium HdN1]|nr:Hypothetical protein HDN1F_19190 [gamma proteobacterium HdN1]